MSSTQKTSEINYEETINLQSYKIEQKDACSEVVEIVKVDDEYPSWDNVGPTKLVDPDRVFHESEKNPNKNNSSGHGGRSRGPRGGRAGARIVNSRARVASTRPQKPHQEQSAGGEGSSKSSSPTAVPPDSVTLSTNVYIQEKVKMALLEEEVKRLKMAAKTQQVQNPAVQLAQPPLSTAPVYCTFYNGKPGSCTKSHPPKFLHGRGARALCDESRCKFGTRCVFWHPS